MTATCELSCQERQKLRASGTAPRAADQTPSSASSADDDDDLDQAHCLCFCGVMFWNEEDKNNSLVTFC